LIGEADADIWQTDADALLEAGGLAVDTII
jgi:hypothetical protein